ncbi:MAG: hypothetical protein ACKKL4_00405 [Patescibacteria group bacterium]
MSTNHHIDPTNGRITLWTSHTGVPILYPLDNERKHGGSLICYPIVREASPGELLDTALYESSRKLRPTDHTNFRRGDQGEISSFTFHQRWNWPALFCQQIRESAHGNMQELEHSFSILHKDEGNEENPLPLNFAMIFYLATYGQNFTLRDEKGALIDWTDIKESAPPELWPTASAYLELGTASGVTKVENASNWECWAIFSTDIARYLAVMLLHPGRKQGEQKSLKPGEGFRAEARLLFHPS